MPLFPFAKVRNIFETDNRKSKKFRKIRVIRQPVTGHFCKAQTGYWPFL